MKYVHQLFLSPFFKGAGCYLTLCHARSSFFSEQLLIQSNPGNWRLSVPAPDLMRRKTAPLWTGIVVRKPINLYNKRL